jgi:ABC-type branched-subunit amino acid transport system permease subunit
LWSAARTEKTEKAIVIPKLEVDHESWSHAGPLRWTALVVIVAMILWPQTALSFIISKDAWVEAEEMMIFALTAASLVLLYRLVGVMSLGAGAFLLVGAYITASLSGDLGLPLEASLAVSALVTAVLGRELGRVCRNRDEGERAAVTLVVSVSAFTLASAFLGYNGITFSNGFHSLLLGSHRFSRDIVIWLGGAIALLVMLATWRAARRASLQDLTVFGTFGATLGLAGGLQAVRMGFVSIEMWVGHESTLILLAATFGGTPTFIGAAVGGAVIEFGRSILAQAGYPVDAVAGGALMLFSMGAGRHFTRSRIYERATIGARRVWGGERA